ncbi:hypothetical protein K2173_004358 [Erythroxylum novogranatense]|uniref:(+)-delta-cadinene synthase n=1 Tax=Erythroxylum novogranatense TaxID=1862640 RepID=A0AAV8T4H3_9ROSI|nr:hypothetical protein K2173_004358 [Erythroxylum novogranatense]
MEFESSHHSIQALVEKIKEEICRDINSQSFIAPSAYDTAFVAMVPSTDEPLRPMFKNCLDWVLNNQTEAGFWGECDSHGLPTLESLPATVACMVALKIWNTGDIHIERGLSFIRANSENFLANINHYCPRWFAIVFPAVVQLADKLSIEIDFPEQLMASVTNIIHKGKQILEKEEAKGHYPPLLSYHEVLPSHYIDDEEHILKHMDSDGSLSKSPSATASVFMATGNKDCLRYLQLLTKKFANGGVPQTYPLDEELINLCIVNQLQRLGLAEYFNEEIEKVLEQVYKSYMTRESWAELKDSPPALELYKDSLAFYLLRLHGFRVSPWTFCQFLQAKEVEENIGNNHEYFSSVMLNVYKATDLMFPGEYELEEARSFSKKLLEKSISGRLKGQDHVPYPNFHTVIEHELKFPWIARMDQLDYRTWIEHENNNALWMGKISYHRLSSHLNKKLVLLALQNYVLRQSIYKKELEELKRWSNRWGLPKMRFCREKTAYCYFAIASSTSLPRDCNLRMIISKSAILVTVADDFYDIEGSLDELRKLTSAVQRWDGKGLSGHSKTIFEVLESLVREIVAKHFQKHGMTEITDYVRNIWRETFLSWLTEATLSRIGCIPLMGDYLETGMISIATHTIALPASCFLQPSMVTHKFRPPKYETITRLLMLIPRLLNDTQSYEKEQKDGKINFVTLHSKQNLNVDIEDSIAFTNDIIVKKTKEFLENALMGGFDDLSRPCRLLHLSCLKVFQMFFVSGNRYDSPTDMIQDIQKSIYVPPNVEPKKTWKLIPHHSSSIKVPQKVVMSYDFDRYSFKRTRIASTRVFQPTSSKLYMTKPLIMRIGSCFL